MANRSDLLLLGLIGVAGWAIWSKVSTVGGAATNALSASIADWWVRITSNPPIVPLGSVYFPDGSYTLVANIPGGVHFDSGTNTGRFTYNNQPWAIPANSRDASGNWPAIPASVYAANPAAFVGTSLPALDFGVQNPSGDWS